MLTRTLEIPEVKEIPTAQEVVETNIEERGFALYEWISRDELRMTLERDYLQIIRWASIPLAVICGIFAFIGFAGGPIGSILAVFGVLAVFYSIVFFYLFLTFIYRSYLYTKGADVTITDNHYVVGGNIVAKKDKEEIDSLLKRYERNFDERFLEDSKLAEKKHIAKTALFDNLKNIAYGGGKIIQSVGRGKNSGGIILALILAGVLYSGMMLMVYFIGIFFISLFGRFFSFFAHLSLHISNNLEYKIQALFAKIDEKSHKLSSSNDTIIGLLQEAKRNEWKDGLLTKINDSLEIVSKLGGESIDRSKELRRILESSKYRDIFNFVKYGHWVQREILEPIESILELLEKNTSLIEKSITHLEKEEKETENPSLKRPLELQRERLILQKESFERNIKLLKGYKEKLTPRKA